MTDSGQLVYSVKKCMSNLKYSKLSEVSSVLKIHEINSSQYLCYDCLFELICIQSVLKHYDQMFVDWWVEIWLRFFLTLVYSGVLCSSCLTF